MRSKSDTRPRRHCAIAGAAALWLALAPSGARADDCDRNVVASAVASPVRPATDRSRDPGRKPAELLCFFGMKPGMAAIEFGAGGGYFTELLANAVGPRGRVIAQNPVIFFKLAGDGFAKRYADGHLPNVAVVFGRPDLLQLPSNSLDVALFIDTYHDIAFASESGERQPPSTAAALAEARRVLKPGAIFAVVDHRAAPGMARAAAAPLHRIDEATLRADFEKAGFVFDGSSDVLRNPSDDRTKAWFDDPALKDNTDRMVHRYRSPD